MEKRFICLENGHIFETPKKYGIGTDAGVYHYYACPQCESAYSPAEQCEVCMDWKLEETGEYIDDHFTCKECLDKLEIID